MKDTLQSALALFLGIEDHVVQRDLAGAALAEGTLWEILRAYVEGSFAEPSSSRTAEQLADAWHRQMVLAYAVADCGEIPEDIALFEAARGAERIAGLAVGRAAATGRLAELDRQLEEIEQREGLDEMARGEGPQDYRAILLVREAEALRVHDTVVLHVLERYGLVRFAALLERDRMRFDVMRETGRRVLMSRPTDPSEAGRYSDPSDERLAEAYGSAALELLRERLAYIESMYPPESTSA